MWSHINKKLGNDNFSINLFFLCLFIKLFLIVFIHNSELFNKMFIPFSNYALENGLKNAYQNFYLDGNYEIFPYSKVMFYIFALPKLLLKNLIIEDYEYVAYKLPLLFSDIFIFFILNSWLKDNSRKIILFYWCSPILMYINYIHSQLDVIPISILFLSLYFLFKKKWGFSFLALGLAMSAKMNVIVVLPFYLIYLNSKEENYLKILYIFLTPIFVYICINYNLLNNAGFQKLVLFNKVQNKVLETSFKIGDREIYAIPFFYTYFILKSFKYKFYNKDLFLMFLGFSFSILTLFIPPMPGWYYWVIPFLSYFYSKNNKYSKRIFIILNFLYFLYFLNFKFLNITILNDKNFIFTILQLFLGLNTYLIYKFGIQSIVNSKINYIPYLVGIGGDSGVGKTTLSKTLTNIFGNTETLIVKGDDMHKWERGHEMWGKFTHLSPKANYLHENFNQLFNLKKHHKIKRRIYDHSTGKFTKQNILRSKKFIIFEGLHPFFLKRNRGLYDLKIFIQPQEELRLHWKIIRDVRKRGLLKEKVLEQLRFREEDSKKYILPQAKYADIIVTYFNNNSFNSIGNESEKVDLGLRLRIDNSIHLDELIGEINKNNGLEIDHIYEENHQIINILGYIDSNITREIFYKFLADIEDYIEEEIKFLDGHQGLLQLIITYCIIKTNKISFREA